MAPSTLSTDHAPVTLRVPFAASSVAVARHRLAEWLEGLEGSVSRDTFDDALIVVSELLGNSVRHAQPLPDGQVVVSWHVEPRGLLVSVTDGGSGTRPRTVHAPAGALAGRGMAIVESLAVTWWADRKQSRCTVHAVLGL